MIPSIDPNLLEYIRNLGLDQPIGEPFSVSLAKRVGAVSQLASSSACRDLSYFFQSEPRVVKLEKDTLGDAYQHVSVIKLPLMSWYIWRASYADEDTAKKELEEYLSADEIEYYETVWLSGIKIIKRISLTECLELIPTNEMPESPTKRRVCSYFDGYPSTYDRPQCALVYKFKDKKTPQDISPGGLRDRGTALSDAISVLNAISGVTCAEYASECTPASGPFAFFGMHGETRDIRDVKGGIEYDVDARMLSQFGDLMQTLQLLTGKKRRQVDLAIQRLSQAKRRKDLKDKVIDACICAEMLLLDDNEKDQLSLSFRLRGAWLLGVGGKNRSQIYDDLNDFYGCRSGVVHSGKLAFKQKQEAEEARVGHFISLSEEIVQQYIRRAPIDWKRLLLSVPL